MKGYTDIEQSKKLAEILPIESADMYYPWYIEEDGDTIESGHRITTPNIGNFTTHKVNKMILPCWSLAALLGVLPNEIITDNRFECHYQIDIRKYDGGDNTTLYQIAYGNNRGSSGSWHDIISTSEQEKFVDVCYEMICWLKENNKL